jgi:hypothetical protein
VGRLRLVRGERKWPISSSPASTGPRPSRR